MELCRDHRAVRPLRVQANVIVASVKEKSFGVNRRMQFVQCRINTGDCASRSILSRAPRRPLNIRLPSVLAAPSRPELFWFLPGCSLLARMQCERLAYHPSFSHADETQGDQPQSWLLPAPRYGKISGQGGRAYPFGRCSCAERSRPLSQQEDRVGCGHIPLRIPNPSPRSRQRNRCPPHPCGKKKSLQNPPNICCWHSGLGKAAAHRRPRPPVLALHFLPE